MGHQVLASGWGESLVTAPGELPCAALSERMIMQRLTYMGT